jgi:Flp pilus assembly protein TadG
MILFPHRGRRRGTHVVEAAIIYPVTFLILLALVTGAMGIFRYQEVSHLAREAARYASTHGSQFRKDTGLARGTPTDWQSDIVTNAVDPNVVSLDPSKLSVTASWPDVTTMPGTPDNRTGSKVTITVSYEWMPEFLIGGPVNLSSTSTMAITN